LPISGTVDRATWAVLVEAGHVLGSRLLEHRSPMLRGDDVADLQQRLCALGFDTDRVDGIFGQLTARAVTEFQKNIGLSPDGVAGPATVDQLLRLGGLNSLTRSVTAVKDGESLRTSSGAERYRTIGLASLGVPEPFVEAIHQQLGRTGLTIHRLSGDERSDPAAANNLGVDLYLALAPRSEGAGYRTLFYSGYTYESASGKDLAHAIIAELVDEGDREAAVVGMAMPLLRETLMTAVIVEVPAVDDVERHASILSTAMTKAITTER
jgi:N-acetylmuramoyl-L-alanine amidase